MKWLCDPTRLFSFELVFTIWQGCLNFKVHLTPQCICSSNKCLCYVKKVGAIFFLFERFLYFLCAVKDEKYLAQVRVYQGPGASRAVT